jgi:hypothetical protein
MEAMTYVNIFETKGLEYLLVISFLLGFIAFVRWLSYTQRPAAESALQQPAAGGRRVLVCPAGPACPFHGGGPSTDPEVVDGEQVA